MFRFKNCSSFFFFVNFQINILFGFKNWSSLFFLKCLNSKIVQIKNLFQNCSNLKIIHIFGKNQNFVNSSDSKIVQIQKLFELKYSKNIKTLKKFSFIKNKKYFFCWTAFERPTMQLLQATRGTLYRSSQYEPRRRNGTAQ